MKKSTFLLFFLTLSLLFTVSCDNDNDYSPSDTVVDSFNSDFPDATDLQWVNYGHYKRAIFNNTDDAPTNAYFDRYGLLLLVHSDIASSAMPAAVSAALDSSQYSTWSVLTDAYLHRINMSDLYTYTVNSGNETFMLHYDEEGTLEMQTVGGPDYNSPNNVPYSVLASISATYTEALIRDAYYLTSGNLEVEILDGSVVKLVVFDSCYAWLYTYNQIKEEAAPDKVLDAITDNSDYDDYTISKIDYLQVEKKVYYYKFTLVNSSDESIIVYVNTSGSIVTPTIA